MEKEYNFLYCHEKSKDVRILHTTNYIIHGIKLATDKLKGPQFPQLLCLFFCTPFRTSLSLVQYGKTVQNPMRGYGGAA